MKSSSQEQHYSERNSPPLSRGTRYGSLGHPEAREALAWSAAAKRSSPTGTFSKPARKPSPFKMKKVKLLTTRQLEVLQAIYYGEGAWEEKYVRGTFWSKFMLDGVDATSVTRILKRDKLIRWRNDDTCHVRKQRGSNTYRYYVVTPIGIEELERHPAPWKE